MPMAQLNPVLAMAKCDENAVEIIGGVRTRSSSSSSRELDNGWLSTGEMYVTLSYEAALRWDMSSMVDTARKTALSTCGKQEVDIAELSMMGRLLTAPPHSAS
ncbi:hypothetical protein H257_01322 [Aphanomyces astaci]|uniref:Uncharacterized protein n=1 Tax=Aphanomyces astaci TaxID=112090 RepID=W4H9F5_APHAT|nr:hypothetical protein H257_01322 [Aphanomyces astaci]ETV87914.1 hypothetical protein H257_01322 [Aphanomyces astaci]|eukprot:XP_009822777.1 hypothetical protein H257_01322 [Aphanomyces astaci]